MKFSLLRTLLILGTVSFVLLGLMSHASADGVGKDGTKFTTASNGDVYIEHTNGQTTVIDHNTGKKKTTTSN